MSPKDERGFEVSCLNAKDHAVLIDEVSGKVDCLGFTAMAPAVKENLRVGVALTASIGEVKLELVRINQRIDGIPQETATIARTDRNEDHRGLREDFNGLRKDLFGAIEKVCDKMVAIHKEGCEQVHMAAESIKRLEKNSEQGGNEDVKSAIFRDPKFLLTLARVSPLGFALVFSPPLTAVAVFWARAKWGTI